jgi:hypothetical protein
MSLPASPQRSEAKRRFGGEVTRLNSSGQFKPFIYLNCRGQRDPRTSLVEVPKRKVPPFGETFLLSLN